MQNVPASLLLERLQEAASDVLSDDTPTTLNGLLNRQQIWAAGVTYKISEEARERESDNSTIYTRVYSAQRPEIFWKSIGYEAVSTGDNVGIRCDATWSIPEPELAIVLNAQNEVIGFTIGNDMRSRDIEGANPLYLPQAKVYDDACALGPRIWLQPDACKWPQTEIGISIERAGTVVFSGSTGADQLHRSLPELVDYLSRCKQFGYGVLLMTGTGEANCGQELVDGLTASVTLGAGQFCTNPGLLLLLDSPQARQFIQDVADTMDAKDPQTLLNACVENNLSRSFAEISGKNGLNTLTGGIPFQNRGYCFANTVLQTTASVFLKDPDLHQELFGPVTLFVLCDDIQQIETVIQKLDGNLTATVPASDQELETASALFAILREKAGRLILNGFPTGVEVVYSMVHGGPYPATTVASSTSVGMTAIQRFMRPVAFQNIPDALLPDALKNVNPLGIWRIVNNTHTTDPIR